MRFYLISTALFILFWSACNKDLDENPQLDNTEIIPEDVLRILDSLPDATGFTKQNIVLPNGEILDDFIKRIDTSFYNEWLRSGPDPFDTLGPQDSRNFLIGKINSIALNLIDRNKFIKFQEGSNKPAQYGLAYSWGGKQYAIREKPPGQGTVCTHEIYGLDCSGFIYQIFLHGGVVLPVGTADIQRKPNSIENAIMNSIPSFQKIKVEDLGTIPTSQLETGDILHWTKRHETTAFHIGMVLKDKTGNLAVLQSNGSHGPNEYECSRNLSLVRGPRIIPLTDPYWFFSDKYTYGVTRINADISGHWEIGLRCSIADFDFVTIDLEFPDNNDQSFEISKSIIYPSDQRQYDMVFHFEYDRVTNILSCSFSTVSPQLPNLYRVDSFNQKLVADEIGYFDVSLDVNQNAGCPYRAKLKKMD